ncbi:MAG: hypothetical protein HZA63_09780 [Rhodocyclales bacterium]|nr:hypothetical protein [Rhodocyclales bacterium]
MRFVLSIAVGLLLPAAPAFCQEALPAVSRIGFDCWVGRDGKPFFTNYIRCIADRDLPQPAQPDPESELILDLLHRELHTRSGADAEKSMKAHIELVRETRAVWSIRIHSYPYEWSWQEGRPEQLVRSVLCPNDVPCTVMIRQH